MSADRASAKQYGARYGRRLREKVGKIDKARRESNTCPYCNYKQIKRVSTGIWLCGKCKSKFTGRAYTIGKKVEVVGKIAQETERPAQVISDDSSEEETIEEESSEEIESSDEKEALA